MSTNSMHTADRVAPPDRQSRRGGQRDPLPDRRDSDDRNTADRLPVGAAIEIRCRFDNSWSNGFVISGYDDRAYRVCRSGDPTELPVAFDRDDIRAVVVDPPRVGRVLWPALQLDRPT